MMNILLFIHIVIAILLIVVILLQKTGADGLSGIGGGGNNMGIVTGRAAANFFTRTTIFLGTLFFINALVLANLSSRKSPDLSKKIESAVEKTSEDAVPIAK